MEAERKAGRTDVPVLEERVGKQIRVIDRHLK